MQATSPVKSAKLDHNKGMAILHASSRNPMLLEKHAFHHSALVPINLEKQTQIMPIAKWKNAIRDWLDGCGPSNKPLLHYEVRECTPLQ